MNNRRDNIRVATYQGNSANSRKMISCRGKKCSSAFKGVSRYPNLKRRPFKASISTGCKTIHIGWYAKEEDAARAYDAKAKELVYVPLPKSLKDKIRGYWKANGFI